MNCRIGTYDKTTEGRHDLAEAIDLGAEVLVGAVGDEDHAVSAGEEEPVQWKGYVTNMKRKH